MWKNKEQPVVKTGKMCRIAQNYEHGRTLPLHAVRWLGIMIDSQNIPLRRMSTNEIRYRWIIGLFISQYTFIKLNISHIYELFRYINPCIHIYFHDKLVRNWCGVHLEVRAQHIRTMKDSIYFHQKRRKQHPLFPALFVF